MSEIMAKLRWYPGDPLVEIRKEFLEKVSEKYGADISLEEVAGKGKELVIEGEIAQEVTADSTLEELTQTVVTVSADSEEAFWKSVRELIKTYRAPRCVYALWGSTERGKELVEELAQEDDGW